MKTWEILNELYNTKEGLNQHTISSYSKIYQLEKIDFSTKVSKEMFDYCLMRKHFVLLVLYDNEKKIFLKREIQEDLFWSLPGGSIKDGEEIYQAVNRIAKSISPEIIIGEIEPVAHIENTFHYKNESVVHSGLGYMARLRNTVDRDTLEGKFIRLTKKELQKIKRYANKQVTVISNNRLNLFTSAFPELEVATNEKSELKYRFAQNVIKKFILTTKKRRKKEQELYIKNIIGEEAKSFIDVSCGENDYLVKILEKCPNLEILVGNDVSFNLTLLNSNVYPSKIFHTNHNAVYLPFNKEVFDVALCKNTLHHMQSPDELKKLIKSLKFIAKKAVIWEIENPETSGLVPKLLNKYYYRGLLNDVGEAFLNEVQFQSLIKEILGADFDIEFEKFENVLGKYNIAIIQSK